MDKRLHNFKISASIVDKKHKFIGIQGRIKRKILIKLNNLTYLYL